RGHVHRRRHIHRRGRGHVHRRGHVEGHGAGDRGLDGRTLVLTTVARREQREQSGKKAAPLPDPAAR
ncbi:MAG TPA: hypothetical protein PKZ28_05110, partial [Piscinibacter sp.]|nr:hypothetical protein [Piscinibacter sp.]